MTVSTPAPGTHDWILIEADYRAGIKSVRSIGEEHGISHTAINKRAKKEGWVRNLAPKIQELADAKVSRAAVSGQVDAETKVPESVVVEANATLQYQVRMAHREDIARGRKLWDQLCAELEATGLSREQIELLLANQTDLTARQRDAQRQALVRAASSSARISNFNTLVHALERLVKLERQAFGIGDDGGEADNPAHPAGFVPGHGRGLSDAERAIRLARLMQLQPGILPAMGATAAPAGATAAPVPVPPGRE